jgi:hypothetical protein
MPLAPSVLKAKGIVPENRKANQKMNARPAIFLQQVEKSHY